MKRILRLYHGAPNIVGRPKANLGGWHRDFGRGFYCTASPEVAGEWACPSGEGGYVNSYEIDTKGLRVLDIGKTSFPTLRWLATLAQNRTFRTDSDFALRALDYLADNFSIDLGWYDIVKGNRGDDSYFSFATDFINNTVSLGQVTKATNQGKDGEQYVLISEEAVSRLRYLGSEPVDAEVCFRRRCERDLRVRSKYLSRGKRGYIDEYDIMMEDLVLGRVERDDPRLQ